MGWHRQAATLPDVTSPRPEGRDGDLCTGSSHFQLEVTQTLLPTFHWSELVSWSDLTRVGEELGDYSSTPSLERGAPEGAWEIAVGTATLS